MDSSQFEKLDPADDAHAHHPHFYLGSFNLSLYYGVTDWLGAGLELPLRFVKTDVSFSDEDGSEISDYKSIHHRNESLLGPGDPSFMLSSQFGWPGLSELSIKLKGGLTLPLGAIEEDPFALGAAGQDHQHIQFGTGTFDPQAGYRINYLLNKITLLHWLDFKTSLVQNSKGFQGGTKIHSGTGILYTMASSNWNFLFQPEYYYESPDNWGSQPARNSGRTDIIIALGTAYRLNPQWMFNLAQKTPVYRETNGGQLETPVIIVMGVTADY